MPVKVFIWLCASVVLIAVAGPAWVMLQRLDWYLATVASSFLLIVALAVPVSMCVHACRARWRRAGTERGAEPRTALRTRSVCVTLLASVGLFLGPLPTMAVLDHLPVNDVVVIVTCSLMWVVSLSLLLIGLRDLIAVWAVQR